MKIWKFDANSALNRVVSIEMPLLSKPIFGGMQGSDIVLWAEVTVCGTAKIKRDVIFAFTGFEFSDANMTHLNSFTDSSGLVYHVYADTRDRLLEGRQ